MPKQPKMIQEINMNEQKNQQTPHNVLPPTTVRTDVLEILDYAYREKRDIEITIQHPEYTSLCPMTGLPDTGTITITYFPDQHIVELKSLKYYLLQFRNVGIFYENIVNHILEDLTGALSPKKMRITGEFTARGGITSKVAALYEKTP